MVPIEQKDETEEDRASKLGQSYPLDSTKRLYLFYGSGVGAIGAFDFAKRSQELAVV